VVKKKEKEKKKGKGDLRRKIGGKLILCPRQFKGGVSDPIGGTKTPYFGKDFITKTGRT